MNATKIGTAVAGAGFIDVDACGKRWHLSRPEDLETLWSRITDDEFTQDERLPYWVELWPASLALASLLYDNKAAIAGKKCLDIGCGLGFTALVASWLGAKVIAMDYEKEALAYAHKNAIQNSVLQPLWAVMDWRFPAIAPRSFSFIWGGDIMYENRFVEPVFSFLEHALAPDGIVWVAEPGRSVYALFEQTLAERGWRSTCVAKQQVEPLHVQKSLVSVNLWQLERC